MAAAAVKSESDAKAEQAKKVDDCIHEINSGLGVGLAGLTIGEVQLVTAEQLLEISNSSSELANSVEVLTAKHQQSKTSAPANNLYINPRLDKLQTAIVACEFVMVAANGVPMKLHPGSMKQLETCNEMLTALISHIKNEAK